MNFIFLMCNYNLHYMQPKESEKPTPKKEKKNNSYTCNCKKKWEGVKEKKQPNKLLTSCDYNISYITCDQINEKLVGETKNPT
jgi:hypothetical protein